MENKMEKRYTFGGFSFGSKGLFNLTISTISNVEYGSSHSIELGLELSPEERQELITLLITLPTKEDN
jgi:hypothetical protein